MTTSIDLVLPDDVTVKIIPTAPTSVDTDFGSFGVIARMNTNFHTLKQEFNRKRRRTANKRVQQALAQIASDAIIAQTLL